MKTETVKHTPGPWTCDDRDKLNPDRAFGIVAEWKDGDEIGTQVVAEVCIAEPGVAEADARLIAAAPDLLACLKKLLANAEAIHSFGIPESVPPLTAVCFSDAQTEARDLIAKAEGCA